MNIYNMTDGFYNLSFVQFYSLDILVMVFSPSGS